MLTTLKFMMRCILLIDDEKTQKKLSDDAIVISLLIFIDKIVLTEH